MRRATEKALRGWPGAAPRRAVLPRRCRPSVGGQSPEGRPTGRSRPGSTPSVAATPPLPGTPRRTAPAPQARLFACLRARSDAQKSHHGCHGPQRPQRSCHRQHVSPSSIWRSSCGRRACGGYPRAGRGRPRAHAAARAFPCQPTLPAARASTVISLCQPLSQSACRRAICETASTGEPGQASVPWWGQCQWSRAVSAGTRTASWRLRLRTSATIAVVDPRISRAAPSAERRIWMPLM
jgi:hypothetical protein